jgi:hypothetical protein
MTQSEFKVLRQKGNNITIQDRQFMEILCKSSYLYSMAGKLKIFTTAMKFRITI